MGSESAPWRSKLMQNVTLHSCPQTDFAMLWHLAKKIEDLFRICPNFNAILHLFCFWPNICCTKWPNMEQINWPSGTTVTSKITQWLTLKHVQSVLTCTSCTSGTTCANCTSCLKLSSDKFLKISEGRQEGTGEWRRLELVKNGASERSSVTRLKIFWKFYATNCPTKVAQIFGDSLGNFENHHFLAKKLLWSLDTFGATYLKIWALVFTKPGHTGKKSSSYLRLWPISRVWRRLF